MALDQAQHRGLVTQSKRAPYTERGHDLYETDPSITRALLKVEQIPRRIWEPACGRGAIVNVLRTAGYEVIASDLVDYGTPITPPVYYGRDFLRQRAAPGGTECILTNPPYRLANEFVAHAIGLAPMVVMLLRLAFLESERRSGILESGKLRRVYVFRNRAPMMHRDNWTGSRTNSAIAFAWFCWSSDHQGPATIHRVSWER
jgi:hypothetical protein